jgi:hypothetical protein
MAFMNRRDFLVASSGALAGTVLCRCGRHHSARFPLLEVSGSPREIGLAIGRRFGEQIKEGLRRRRDWFDELRCFMERDRATRYEPFLAAGQEHFPDIVEELRGWADGSGLPFDDLMTLNLKAELAAMMHDDPAGQSGCSTIALSQGERRIIAHNEDGNSAYHDLMFLVRVTQPGKPGFCCLTYPGILCGNGPAVNDAGIVLTTNYIASLQVRPGVPRYFLSRAALNATALDEAVETVTHPARAFAFHYNLGSRDERKILSVETTAWESAIREVSGVYVHTNHLLLPGMSDTPQDMDYVESSSMSRYRVLHAAVRGLDGIRGETLVGLLSSHDSAPYSPCRHPTAKVAGATLGNALFDLTEGSLRLAYSNPCRDQTAHYRFPTS